MSKCKKAIVVLSLAACAIPAHAFVGWDVWITTDEVSPPFAGRTRYYKSLKALNSGFFVQVGEASTKSGAQVIQWSNPDSMHGHWELISKDSFKSPPVVKIRNRWSRQCLDIASTAIGAAVIQRSCDGRPSQSWILEKAPGPATAMGAHYVRNLSSGLDLNVEGAAIAIGARLIQWPHMPGAQNAIFHIEFSLPHAITTD